MTLLVKRRIYDKKMAKNLRIYDRDFNWIQDNRDKLIKQHPNVFIAVRNRQVKFTAESMEEIILLIKDAGANLNQFIIDHMSDKKISLIL